MLHHLQGNYLIIGTVNKILKTDLNYPENLKNVSDAPNTLYVEGQVTRDDSFAVAIVGTRTPTSYGKEVAKEIATNLSKAGVTIVSGLARGIDTIAHSSALEAGGRTIAVMASGLDVVYPPENIGLFKRIIKNGAIVTEIKSGIRPQPKFFLARNRIVSGLSLAVVVIEGKRRSGTLSTATHAANQGREVFAVPGPVNSPQSEAPLYLIEQGASVARSAQDILDILR